MIQKIKRLIDFTKRTKAQWYKELANEEAKLDWNEPIASETVRYEFFVEHHPLEGTYHPKFHKHIERLDTIRVGKKYRPFLKKVSTSQTIVLRTLKDWYTVNPWRGTDEKRCETRQEAIGAIELYKEAHLNMGVKEELVETIER